MTKTNLPTLAEIATDPGAVSTLPLDALEAILFAADAQKATADAARNAVRTTLEKRYGERAAQAYLAEGKDTGTVHIHEGDFDLVCDRVKKVEWDQAELRAIGDKIAEAGDDPFEYLEQTLKMEERRFTALPASIAKVFAPARTVKPGPLTIKIVHRVEAARAA